MLYSDVQEARLCKIVNNKVVMPPRGCVFFGNWNVQQKGGGWNGTHGLRNHLYLNSEDVDLNDGVAFAHCKSMQDDVQIKREVLLRYVDCCISSLK